MDVRISVHETKDDNLGTRRPAVIGFVFGTKPDVHIVVTLHPAQFERVFAMALAGCIKKCVAQHDAAALRMSRRTEHFVSNEPIESSQISLRQPCGAGLMRALQAD